jgi:hypothetical protein
MKKLISFLIRLLSQQAPSSDSADEKTWEHLDGAEFFVVFPRPKPNVPAE